MTRRKLGRFGNVIGKAVFSVILTICYAVLFAVRGVMRRKYEMTFVSWSDAAPPAVSSAWRPKQLTAVVSETGALSRPLAILPLLVVGYFARQKQYVLIPILLVMIVLGLLLLFLQTSVFAPFIYTLF